MLSHNTTRIPAVLILVGLACILLDQVTDAFTGARVPSSCARRNRLFSLSAKARNGMEFDDITLGQGRRVLPGDTVYCYYVGSFTAPNKNSGGPLGALLGGGGDAKPTVFDQVTEGEPFSFKVGKGQVIQGMDLGILGFDGEIPPMNVGGKRQLRIPSGLAYGEEPMGPIPANQDLQFELEILDAGGESSISLQFRLGGYAVALGVPAIIALIAFNLLSGNWNLY